jgi:protease-4
MSDLPNNIAVLTHLKDKVHKWKNIAILGGVFSFLLLLKMVAGAGDIGASAIDGDYIANIKIDGMILEDDYRSEVLEKVADEDAIKAVVVDIDSPGGGIVGSEILFSELKTIAAKKPLVVVMGSVAASGGYMAAIASDYIIAHNGTLTGSIGVLMQSAEFTDLASKVGVKLHTYKSAPLKASPSPFEKSNPLVDRVIDESIKDSAEFFFDLVRERRGKKLNVQEFGGKLFDGRVFTGRQALQAGLIDEIGGKEQALAYLSKVHQVDTKSLKMREVPTVKTEDNFLQKIFGFLPFSNSAKALDSKNGIMAVLSL